ncbi:bifunctional diguanylate cyclase/phosphodiesterase [Lysobacter sp. CFH 32150]|uniref:putative bifunctional diguanylate cyclase/phosphodiesterase n=1 Tax=Lysobacter sp. CFH 32150 TaxID=2927128 RepID=UPI001FA7D94A|nr:bifunctional diguanylate cyclase/phosphodiesterase [Lysobacter sp. CFH 32150]MCI4567935.1 bifunctional diguanylate cyclase/phosphodiesterase [Lysobacter sp. CFH 32150]
MTTAEDALTGLHNRRSFMSLLRRHIGLANDHQTNLGLAVIDIDGFARINATHGFDFGDRVLVHLANQVREVARKQDYVARIGDNRFALVLTRVMNKGHVELAVQKLFRLLDLPFEAGATRLKLPVTVGAALCPMHASQADYLLRQAEMSIEAARAIGQHSMFAPDNEQDTGLSEFWDLEIELAGAVERGEITLHYQPKLRASDRQPVGAEALMRWHHRTRGLVSPNLFIPIAEQTGQIRAMTMWAMNTALRHASEWRGGPLSVAVNVPANLVARHDLPDLVENALHLWGRDSIQLTLEITERSLVADPKHSFAILSRIRDLGVKISIDDFGTGYSCLAYFKDIPADELKIDRSFVCGLLDDPACADITALIIDLAHRFGLSVVAEGVEDEATFLALLQRGCDVVQGYHFGEAMPPDAFARWLAQSSGGPKHAADDFATG